MFPSHSSPAPPSNHCKVISVALVLSLSALLALLYFHDWTQQPLSETSSTGASQTNVPILFTTPPTLSSALGQKLTVDFLPDISIPRRELSMTKGEQQSPRHALIIATTLESEFSWALTYFAHLEVYQYATWTNTTRYHGPVNIGKEVMVYLTFIIDNYHDLPERMVFLHSHRCAWHQEESDIVDLLQRLRWEKHEYANLRCESWPGCCGSPGYDIKCFADLWNSTFAKHGFGSQPKTVNSACCSQFMVHKSAVLRHAVKLYEDLRGWLIQTSCGAQERCVVFEYAWHIMFGNKGPVDCPVQEVCVAETFRESTMNSTKCHGRGDNRVGTTCQSGKKRFE